MNRTVDVLRQLDPTQKADTLFLKAGTVAVTVRCPSAMTRELRRHFAEALIEEEPEASIVVEVLDRQTLETDPVWTDWAREPGKSGRKDTYHDLEDGRLIRKVRTGMTFLQSAEALIAFGPCAQHPNQVINFINTQILNTCKRSGWEICHAAALTNGVKGLAIAGLSGGGKSTAMLKLLDLRTTRFVTNDRLMIRSDENTTIGLGIPKNPRINPGTILHNVRLTSLLSEERHQDLLQMPNEDLWNLEEKHDLFVSEVFGPDRVQFTTPLTEFWVLNWSRTSSDATEIHVVDLKNRPDVLGAIMKSAGPFYQNAKGTFLKDTDPLEPASYLRQLQNVRVREVTGTIDFDAIAVAGKQFFS